LEIRAAPRAHPRRSLALDGHGPEVRQLRLAGPRRPWSATVSREGDDARSLPGRAL